MDKKYFFDIDGTLLDDNKELPQSTLESIELLKEKGHHVVIATGRPPFIFENVRDTLGITSFVSMNGQFVVHESETIYKNPIAHDEIEKLIHFSDEQKHPLILVNDSDWDATMENHPHLEKAIDSLKIEQALPSNRMSFKTSDNYQVMLFCEEGEDAPYIEKFPDFKFVRWHDYSLDILPKDSSKAVGILKLLDALSLDIEDAYAFGDGLNDKEMLTLIPNSVAMGNAVDEVKSTAKYVTSHVNNDGIYSALRKMQFI